MNETTNCVSLYSSFRPRMRRFSSKLLNFYGLATLSLWWENSDRHRHFSLSLSTCLATTLKSIETLLKSWEKKKTKYQKTKDGKIPESCICFVKIDAYNICPLASRVSLGPFIPLCFSSRQHYCRSKKKALVASPFASPVCPDWVFLYCRLTFRHCSPRISNPPKKHCGKVIFSRFITIKVAKKKINKGNTHTHTQEGIAEVAFQQNIPSKILSLRLSQERYITENSIALFKRNKLIFNSLTITSSFLREGVIARSIFCFLSSRSFILFFLGSVSPTSTANKRLCSN